jgi:predicted O-methyltransferase YrrM
MTAPKTESPVRKAPTGTAYHRTKPILVVNPRPSVSPLRRAARRGPAYRTAAHTLEIGFGYGISALFICDGLLANADADARHVVLDPNQSTRFGGCGLQLADEAGIAEMLEFHEEASEIALPRFLAEERRFDLAFVDGNHRFDGVFLDLIYLGRLLRPGGILFVDDYQLPAVARAASFCLTNLGWTLEEVSADDDLHHWAVLRTSGIPDARPFDDYVDF